MSAACADAIQPVAINATAPETNLFILLSRQLP
jgi:hypothetical protein